jgi:hypothetical protein
MLEQRLIYRGGGSYQTATRLDLELAERTFQAGEECAARVTHKRSVRQNNTFHVMIQYAHDNQRAGPLLPSWEHLKKWLLIKAGHYSERRFGIGDARAKMTHEQIVAIGKMLAHAFRSRDDYVAIAYDPKTEEFVERTAKSVRFTAAMSDEMKELFGRVAEIICREIIPGTDPEELIEAAKASCGRGRSRVREAA